jgi:microcin C transport system substrate-binding protein
MGGSTTPGVEMKNSYSSQAATTPGSRNIAGISSPAIDALLDRIARADNRADLTIACRALDRILRAGRYWVPMWYSGKARIAYWDVFSRPAQTPKFGTGAPATWWWDEEKAKRLGMQG